MAVPVADEKGTSIDTAATEAGVSEPVLHVDHHKEKKLLLKLDTYIAPLMTIIFLAAYLDRSNIGNAASAGMTDDLGMSSGELGNAVTLFYVTYVLFELPCSLVMKKLHTGRMIPALIFGWSIVTIGTGFIHNAGQMYGCRLLLGFFESGMFPCLALYLSTFYQPKEQALRVSYLLVAAALSGAFGGLFAYAILKMDGIAGLAGWRWLFIIEGCGSVVVALLIFLLLPDDYETARFLTEEDREMMRVRAALNARYNGKPDFDWAEVIKAFKDLKLYISCWNQFWADICSFGLSIFLPLIIQSLGFGTVKTQLLTIPVFFWAAIGFVGVSWLSDHYRMRAAFMIPSCLATAIGYAINLGTPSSNQAVQYFSTFLIAPGIYIVLGLNCSWLLNCHAGYYKRATAVGMNQSIGNAAGVVVGQIFKNTVDGKYLLGLSFSLGSIVLAALGHASLYLLLRYHNKKREALSEEDKVVEIERHDRKGADFHPDFRYAL